MVTVTVKDIPHEVHQALCSRARQHGCSTVAEIRDILKNAVMPPKRMRLGSLLVSIAQEAGELTDAEAGVFDSIRDKTAAEPLDFK
jgi:plasmid stability protein